MSYQTIDVQPVSGALAAEVSGIDLAQPLDNQTFSEVYQAWNEHLVLFFRDQQLTPEQHLAFGRRFGRLNQHPYIAGMRDYPDIIEIIKEPREQRNWGGQWHADLTCLEKPPMGSILYAHEVPAWGGDTLFANMYLAYESLSEGMRSLLDSLVAVHESGEPRLYSDGYLSMHGRQNDGACGTEHPVVRTHPETGRKALYVNRDYTRRFKDMTAEESAPLIRFLFEHAARPEFTCRFRWRQHSVAFWDNRCVHHHALSDFHPGAVPTGRRRHMHRVTIEGERPH
jgi:taurine dioxygenase